ncbi:hypothetical protein SPRG_11510 [Saprolegnia parasitica CBS 223.65]|uniref:Uncharacterized protein n=1 Tax=Saprolegnia parasitica (strain CBS 223.65) TaxID=695850 RepID=A0A067C9C2_SAPPC|nr:hypothetical protein SPRG_11510 [Saprolegnia parasitica CBS 223.65]KDO23417.1 hypothetical protein SPRG_11510 [Saprolegnia parasitica CBS 223.65]|eukprot:XP_012205905.1 hypothetical protein SPRG_11510 [Saprolegnia parasitica CBS 223.65]
MRRLAASACVRRRQSFSVDWIQIIKAPTITKMTKTNTVHPRFTMLFVPLSRPYAIRYNCMTHETIAI